MPYSEAKTMPVPFALALLNGLKDGRQNNTHSSNSGGKRKVATRRKSRENE
ncbi:hypothetical protein [Acinetobacter haemolyticus]|uniref:hypothetical protein n=1 Tax=Acinetobacter haemolyticus TaxID=29430 RepID=UPI00148ED269|nr:hypothetical protein [Acinetobacter haemolyticus]